MSILRNTAGVLLALALPALSAAAVAQSEPPQVERQHLMDTIGDSTKVLGDMLKGSTPYDAAQATAALEAMIASAERFPTLFPEGTQTGHDTRALAAIWTDRAAFDQAALDLVAAAEAAVAPAQESLAALGPAFREIGLTCRGCHQEFRADRD